jgi:hypothetical protein
MPYTKSVARRSLESSYVDIVRRLRLVEKKGTNPDIREYVTSAAIFLAHAMIENYLSDIFSSFANCACSGASNASSLPTNLRSHLFIHKANAGHIFANFIATRSEKDVIKAFATSISGPASGFVNYSVATPVFSGKDIYLSNKYPSKDNLRKLFFRIGVSDIFMELNRILRRDSITLLESLGSLRTSLAHNGSLPGISAKDARDRMADATKFINSIDRVIYREACAHFSAGAWHACAC